MQEAAAILGPQNRTQGRCEIYLPKETVSDVESCLRTVIISLSKLSPDNMALVGAGDGDGEEEEDGEGEGNDAILF